MDVRIALIGLKGEEGSEGRRATWCSQFSPAKLIKCILSMCIGELAEHEFGACDAMPEYEKMPIVNCVARVEIGATKFVESSPGIVIEVPIAWLVF